MFFWVQLQTYFRGLPDHELAFHLRNYSRLGIKPSALRRTAQLGDQTIKSGTRPNRARARAGPPLCLLDLIPSLPITSSNFFELSTDSQPLRIRNRQTGMRYLTICSNFHTRKTPRRVRPLCQMVFMRMESWFRREIAGMMNLLPGQ